MKYLAAAALALLVASPALAQQAPGTDATAPSEQAMHAPAQAGDANKFMTNEGVEPMACRESLEQERL